MDPTQWVRLGRSPLTVTRLGVGTVPIGGMFAEVSEETAAATLRRAYELGVRYFDTAPLYGHGVSERRLGEFLRTRPRQEFVVSTKVGRLLKEERPDDPQRLSVGFNPFQGAPLLFPTFDFTYDGAMRSVETSLIRLGLHRIDALLIHDPDDYPDEAMAGAYVALSKLRREGVVGAIGVGMNQAEMLARLAREGEFDCFLVAGRYTLLDQAALGELLPICVERNISVIIGGVYNSGILTDPQPGATFNYRPADAPWVAKAQRLKAVCERHGTPLMAAAIQFPLGHPAIATVLTGVRSPAEIEENDRLFRFPIPPELWHDLKAEGLLPEAAPTPSG
ncbi:MAG TPA: aldo/keto reductase [Chloroflexota bacterium]